MDASTNKLEEKVKDISVADGCLYVDLLCGLRVSCPLLEIIEPIGAGQRRPAAEAPAPAARP